MIDLETARSAVVLFALSVVACAGSSPTDSASPPGSLGPRPARPGASASPVGAASCPPTIDLQQLLGRHAAGFGSAAAVAAVLPVSMKAEVQHEDRRGASEVIVDRDRQRTELWLGPIHVAGGTDPRGSWALGMSGVVTRLEPPEAVGVVFDGWLARRGYLGASRGDARCAIHGGRARVTTRADAPEVGNPELTFDLDSAALVEIARVSADGDVAAVAIEAWSAPDASGIRWPKVMVERSRVQSPSRTTVTATRGLECRAGSGDRCLEPPTPRFRLEWPASGRVRVPLEFALSSLFVRARLGGQEVRALLDSGAGLTAIDGTGSAAASFRSEMEMSGSSATQKVRFGLGELERVELGELVAKHLPAVSVPIPGLANMGDRRPALILGESFFEAATVRIDYARGEVVLAPGGADLARRGAAEVPLRLLDGKIVVDAEIEDVRAPITIDTGNTGSFDLVRAWAEPHGIPGARPVHEERGQFSAGTEETTRREFELRRARLGPIDVRNERVTLDDPPGAGLIAGLVGNAALSRCAAIVLDVSRRRLWLEAPCDRPVPTARAGWRLVRKDDAAFPDRPWVLTNVAPDGSAGRAGLADGDRLLELGGKPATLDLVRIHQAVSRPVGTRLDVVVARAAQRKQVVMTLVERDDPP